MYVRQHYNLATSGKLGQKAAPKAVAGRKPSTHGMHGKSMKRGGGHGSYGTKGRTPA